MLIILKWLVFLILLIYTILVASVYILQNRRIFRPGPKGKLTPQDFGLEFKNIAITSNFSGVIRGWWVPNNTPQKRTLLYCHGNAAVLSDVAHVARIFYDWGFEIFFVEYRGFGGSDPAKLSEAGIVEDAVASFDWVANEIGHNRIVVWGHSLGSSVAAHLASKRKVYCLILEAPFVSIAEIAKYRYPWLPILNFFIRNKFQTLKYVNDRVGLSPTLIMHGTKDNVIPYEQGYKLYSLILGSKEFLCIDGIDHNQFPDVADQYKERILQWIDQTSE